MSLSHLGRGCLMCLSVVLVAQSSLCLAQQQVLFYDNFDQNSLAGWTALNPYQPTITQVMPQLVQSPEGYAVQGRADIPQTMISRPLDLSDVGELTVELRAKSAHLTNRLATVWLFANGNDFYHVLDYAEQQRADFTTYIGGAEVYRRMGSPIDPTQWHTLAWHRSADGWWSLSIDGQTTDANFVRDMRLTSFTNLGIHTSYAESQIEWVRISGTPIPEPATLSLLAVTGLLGLRRLRGPRH